jgi:hypothetical protein
MRNFRLCRQDSTHEPIVVPVLVPVVRFCNTSSERQTMAHQHGEAHLSVDSLKGKNIYFFENQKRLVMMGEIGAATSSKDICAANFSTNSRKVLFEFPQFHLTHSRGSYPNV